MPEIDYAKHALEEIRALRTELVDGQREQRVVVDRLRDRHNEELSSIHERISSLDVKMTKGNEQRLADHRALAQRVTIYAGVVASAVGIATAWAKDFFFR